MPRALLWLAMTATLAGCAVGGSGALPTAPPIPQGWTTVERGGLRMALPADWQLLDGQDDILVSFAGSQGGDIAVVSHAPPWFGEVPPDGSASKDDITRWLLHLISTTAPDRYSTDELRLPAGPAVVVRYHFPGEAGSYEAVEGAAYAINTDKGFIYVQTVLSESLVAQLGEVMNEIPWHAALAPTAQ